MDDLTTCHGDFAVEASWSGIVVVINNGNDLNETSSLVWGMVPMKSVNLFMRPIHWLALRAVTTLVPVNP